MAATKELVPDEDELNQNIWELEDALKSIEAQLTPFFALPLEELSANLDGVGLAKLNIVMAYAINTLFYVYLKTQGVSPNEHPVKKELERIKLYISKIKEVTEKKQESASMKINVEAAERFIKHSLQNSDTST